ncbi:hypothetical protein AAG570_010292 [Ranatra chinensis]|uniref:Mediator of RNA polymerase II transcription subunit 9 n=1 Tax=Ranatra chinensis TaxID=642074 RepID=A0ABD0YMI4_9HEMI
METSSENQDNAPARLTVDQVDVEFLPIIYDIIRGLERDPHDTSQKLTQSQDVSQKVIELHKKLEEAKEQVNLIFIDQPIYEKHERSNSNLGLPQRILSHLDIPLTEVPNRVCASFLPPVFHDHSKKVYVDLIGPLLAVLTLSSILHYGHSFKYPPAAIQTSPIVLLVYYSTLMPLLCYSLVRLGGSNLGLLDVTALIGYGLFGHIFTILSALVFDNEESNTVFFIMMAVFGGLSGLRIVLILLMTIPRPPARLLVCSLVSVMHLLFLIFVHFAYMHRTFIYGNELSLDY